MVDLKESTFKFLGVEGSGMILMKGYWYQRGREIESYQVDNQEHVLLFGLKKLHQFDIGKTNSDELKLKK